MRNRLTHIFGRLLCLGPITAEAGSNRRVSNRLRHRNRCVHEKRRRHGDEEFRTAEEFVAVVKSQTPPISLILYTVRHSYRMFKKFRLLTHLRRPETRRSAGKQTRSQHMKKLRLRSSLRKI